MTPAMRTSTRVDFSGRRSTEASLLATWKYGLSAFLASESSALAGDQASSAAVGEHRDQHAEDDAAEAALRRHRGFEDSHRTCSDRPADAAGMERSIGSGREASSKRRVPLFGRDVKRL